MRTLALIALTQTLLFGTLVSAQTKECQRLSEYYQPNVHSMKIIKSKIRKGEYDLEIINYSSGDSLLQFTEETMTIPLEIDFEKSRNLNLSWQLGGDGDVDPITGFVGLPKQKDLLLADLLTSYKGLYKNIGGLLFGAGNTKIKSAAGIQIIDPNMAIIGPAPGIVGLNLGLSIIEISFDVRLANDPITFVRKLKKWDPKSDLSGYATMSKKTWSNICGQDVLNL